jgi:hypothetical protein
VGKPETTTATSTYAPTSTRTMTPTKEDRLLTEYGPYLPYPENEPLEYFNDIRIMPGAISGRSSEFSYCFMIISTKAEIESFYKIVLKDFGWKLGIVTAFGTDERISHYSYTFTRDEENLSFSIYILDENQGLYYVYISGPGRYPMPAY